MYRKTRFNNENRIGFQDILRQIRQTSPHVHYFFPMTNANSVLDENLNEVGVPPNPQGFTRRQVNIYLFATWL